MKKSSRDGFCNLCKECDRERCKRYYKKNSDVIISNKKKYNLENDFDIKQYQRLYRFENKDTSSKYRLDNSEYFKNWWKSNRDKARTYEKRYKDKYPHIIACRNSLKSCLYRIGLIKSQSSSEILKYNPEEFKVHIESLFTNGMCWSNYGDWHVDHIIPVSKFDKLTPVYIINSLDNLQPLWAKDNLSKSNRI